MCPFILVSIIGLYSDSSCVWDISARSIDWCGGLPLFAICQGCKSSQAMQTNGVSVRHLYSLVHRSAEIKVVGQTA